MSVAGIESIMLHFTSQESFKCTMNYTVTLSSRSREGGAWSGHKDPISLKSEAFLPQAGMRLWSSVLSSPPVPLCCSFKVPRREAAEEVRYWTGQQSYCLRNPTLFQSG